MIIVPEPTCFQNGEQGCEHDNPATSTIPLVATSLSDVLTADIHELKQSCVPPKCKSRHNTRRRTVAFDMNSIREYSNKLPITEEEIHDLWFGNETKRRARATVIALRRQSSTTSDEEDSTTDSYLEYFKRALTISQSPDEKLDNLVKKMSMDSPLRGLEHCLFSEIAESRRKAIHKILRAQTRLPPHTSPVQRAFLLREVSRNLSRPSRWMAQLLATVDAKVVLEEMMAARAAIIDAQDTSI